MAKSKSSILYCLLLLVTYGLVWPQLCTESKTINAHPISQKLGKLQILASHNLHLQSRADAGPRSVSTTEGRLGFGFGSPPPPPPPPPPAPSCDAVYGVQSGDTCFQVSKMFNLSPGFFSEINPNLDCDKLFIGQWLCIRGSA